MDEIKTFRYLELKQLYDSAVKILHTYNHPVILALKLELDKEKSHIQYKSIRRRMNLSLIKDGKKIIADTEYTGDTLTLRCKHCLRSTLKFKGVATNQTVTCLNKACAMYNIPIQAIERDNNRFNINWIYMRIKINPWTEFKQYFIKSKKV